MTEIVELSDTKIEVLYSEEAIRTRVAALAQEISRELSDNPLVISVLKGGFVFSSDLVRALYHQGVSPEIDFMALSSYGDSTESSGKVKITRDLSTDVAGRDILMIDDILESGNTLHFAKNLLRERGAKSIRTAVVLDKSSKRKADIEADFAGFVVEDLFVIGYGMDKARRYRELPFIGVVVD